MVHKYPSYKLNIFNHIIIVQIDYILGTRYHLHESDIRIFLRGSLIRKQRKTSDHTHHCAETVFHKE